VGHASSRLTPFGRRLLVDRVEVGGWSVAAASCAAGSGGCTPSAQIPASARSRVALLADPRR